MNNTTKNAAMVLRAVNNKFRIKMIDYLRNNTDATVTSVFVSLKVDQSVASQHLAIMRKAGVVICKRDGKFRTYSVDETRIKEIDDLSKKLSTYNVK